MSYLLGLYATAWFFYLLGKHVEQRAWAKWLKERENK